MSLFASIGSVLGIGGTAAGAGLGAGAEAGIGSAVGSAITPEFASLGASAMPSVEGLGAAGSAAGFGSAGATAAAAPVLGDSLATTLGQLGLAGKQISGLKGLFGTLPAIPEGNQGFPSHQANWQNLIPQLGGQSSLPELMAMSNSGLRRNPWVPMDYHNSFSPQMQSQPQQTTTNNREVEAMIQRLLSGGL